jgi:hypothetical protein
VGVSPTWPSWLSQQRQPSQLIKKIMIMKLRKKMKLREEKKTS